MTTPVRTSVPVVPVLVAGAAGQLADNLLLAVVPSFPGMAAILALLFTAGAARIVTRRMAGSAVPRAGLAIGVVSAGVGLAISGLGLVALLIAGLTVLAGVAGAVIGRPEVRPGR
ncbi:hypothetical protein GCM10009836_67590 [Pseudonocardia ailaonensis]|uniref:Major facilitator superfamily (MFS) profile domain-containing protein n=1 Tax=Pseudonocardia ailaonensis TaxID=367279 RepID=A0ABN2NNB8_9PSEU